MRTLQLDNGLTLQLCSRGRDFLGIGNVSLNGVALRSGARPWFAQIRTPEGVEFCHYQLRDLWPENGGFTLEFDCRARAGGPMEWMVHEVRPRWNTSDWSAGPFPAPETKFRLQLRPAQRQINGQTFTGLSYQFHFESSRHRIYRILDRGTWELGGQALGNEFWMRNCFVPSRVAFTEAGQFHSTEWYLPDCLNPSAFQFLPWQTELQGFSFTCSNAGTLITWATEPAHIRSLFEKKREWEEIEHWHEHCGDLAAQFSTSPVEVLFSPAGGADSASECRRFNTYEAVKEMVHASLHGAAGLRRERVTTFGMIEEWGLANLQAYRLQGLPRLLEAGAKTVYLANHFQNHMNTYGVPNFCCTLDYKVADSVGEENLTEFCHDANSAGAAVEMWANTALSALSTILGSRQRGAEPVAISPSRPPEDSIMEALGNSPGAFVLNASNAIEADHYTPVFCVLNLRDAAVRSYWRKRWSEARQKVGLGGIFLDSSFNLSSDKFHWVQKPDAHLATATADQNHLLGHYRPSLETPGQILSQYHAHLELVREMQQMGYRYCNEDLGVFGVHRHGPSLGGRLDTLPIWADCLAEFNRQTIADAGAEEDDIFFRGLAVRTMWMLFWNPGRDELSFRYGTDGTVQDRPSSWQLELLRAYNAVEADMQLRTILGGAEGGAWSAAAGVHYASQDGSRHVLWTFRECIVSARTDGEVRDVLQRENACRRPGSPPERRSTWRARARHIYCWEGGPPAVEMGTPDVLWEDAPRPTFPSMPAPAARPTAPPAGIPA